MAFVAPIIGFVAGAIGTVSTFVAGLGIAGQLLITVGLNVAAAYINKKRRGSQQQQQGGVQFERQYGADVERQVAFGVVGIAGHDTYINTYGSSNKYLQQIYTLSDYYTSGLNRIAINGEYVTFSDTEEGEKGYRVTSGEFAGFIWVKFIDGRQTSVNQFLKNNANPRERWDDNHIGLGISYVIVSMTYDQEKNNSFPDFFFEFLGAPLYDWRKDSSVGGNGNQRWNDKSTHTFSDNPIVIEYNYRRGLSINNDMFCGMGMPAADLPLDKYTIAANLCDEIKEDNQPAYRCSIIASCMDTHGLTIEAIATSCGAMHVDGVAGSWPLVGSAQPIVATFTDNDLVTGERIEYRAKRSMADLVNTVSGSFPNPDDLWSMVSYETQSSNIAITADRRTRDLNMDFPQVRHHRQAAQLARIYLYENRFEANAKLTLKSRFKGLEPGDWVRWNSERYGNKVYIVADVSLASLDSDKPRSVLVTLQERDASIYDTLTVPPIVLPYPPGVPQYMTEVQNFAVIPIYVMADNGGLMPAIRASWSALNDDTVVDVMIEYWPVSQPENRIIARASERIVVPLVEGVVGVTEYAVRTKLVTDPPRTISWNTPIIVETYASQTDGPVDWTGIADDLQGSLEFALNNIRDQISWSQELQANIVNMQYEQYHNYEVMNRSLVQSIGRTSAKFSEQITAAVGPGSAIVQSLTELQAQISGKADAETVVLLSSKVDELGNDVNAFASAIISVNASADGTVQGGQFSMVSSAGTGGFTTRISMLAKSSTADSYKLAGMFINVSPTQSQIMFLANSLIIADPDNYLTTLAPFVFENGVLTLTVARIQELVSGVIRSPDSRFMLNIEQGRIEWWD